MGLLQCATGPLYIPCLIDYGIVTKEEGVINMKLLFKQRFFSWLDSYDIYDEQGQIGEAAMLEKYQFTTSDIDEALVSSYDFLKVFMESYYG
jgi:hypothetical protein